MKRCCTMLLLSSAVLSTAACRQTRCEDLRAEPIEGAYRGGGSLGEERMRKVSFEATSQQVVLTYSAQDGSRIRALYRVLEKSKVR